MGKTHRHSASYASPGGDGSVGGGGGGGRGGKQKERLKNRPNKRRGQHGPHNYHTAQERDFLAYLSSQGLRLVEMVGDGNCLFRSVAHQLFCTGGDEDQAQIARHKEVRKQVVTFLQEHWEDYFFYTIDEESYAQHAGDLAEMTAEEMKEQYDSYVEEMAEDGTWGAQLELVAITHVYRCHVIVYQPHAPTYIIHSPCPLTPVKYCQVSFHGDCHYNSIVGPVPASLLQPTDQATTCSSSSSSSGNSGSDLVFSTPSPNTYTIKLKGADVGLVQKSFSWIESHHLVYTIFVLIEEEGESSNIHAGTTSTELRDKILDLLCVQGDDIKQFSRDDMEEMLPAEYLVNLPPAVQAADSKNDSNTQGTSDKETTNEQPKSHKGKKPKEVKLSKKEMKKLEKQAKQRQERVREKESKHKPNKNDHDDDDEIGKVTKQVQNIVL